MFNSLKFDFFVFFLMITKMYLLDTFKHNITLFSYIDFYAIRCTSSISFLLTERNMLCAFRNHFLIAYAYSFIKRKKTARTAKLGYVW